MILAGGTGNPFVTTDTAAALRGSELEADMLLKATRVDGVYTADPEKNPHAEKYDRLTYEKVIQTAAEGDGHRRVRDVPAGEAADPGVQLQAGRRHRAGRRRPPDRHDRRGLSHVSVGVGLGSDRAGDFPDRRHLRQYVAHRAH